MEATLVGWMGWEKDCLVAQKIHNEALHPQTLEALSHKPYAQEDKKSKWTLCAPTLGPPEH